MLGIKLLKSSLRLAVVATSCRMHVCWLVAALLLSWSLPSAAQHSADQVLVGIEGVVKRGRWAELHAPVEAGGAVHSYDGEGLPLTTITSGGVPTARYVKLGRNIRKLALQTSDSATHSAASIPLHTTKIASSLQQLIVVFGGDIGLDAAIKFRRRRAEEAILGHQVERSESLPSHRLGYDGVDVLVLCTSDPATISELNESQWLAIRDWIVGGGHLLVAVGSNADTLLTSGNRLATMLPGQFVKAARQRQSTGLESFAKAGKPLALRDELGRIQGVPTLLVKNIDGEVLLEEGSGDQQTPWLIRSSYGLGTILWFTGDLDSGPIAAWPDRPRFVARLLDILLPGASGQEERRGGQVRHLGFSDLAGQLRVALGQFPGVSLIPFSLIAGLLAAYVLCVGPLDYFLLRQLGGQMHWTWITFPLLVIGFGAVAGVLVQRLKSNEVQTNQVDLVDVDLRLGMARCTSWAYVYAPRPMYFDLDLRPARPWRVENPETLVTWDGLPGAAFSGLEGQGAQPPLVEPYENRLALDGPHLAGTLQRVGLPARATRSLLGSWRGQLALAGQHRLTLDENGLLKGQLSNPLPVTLRDAAVACGPWYYKIGTLPPGASFALESVQRKQNLTYRLTRRSVDQSGDRNYTDITTPWKQTSFDVGRIMEMIMFHAAAGGRDYTGLVHRYQGQLDMSDQLNMQTAILFGRLDVPASQWTVTADGLGARTERNWAFGRVLIPVQRNDDSEAAP